MAATVTLAVRHPLLTRVLWADVALTGPFGLVLALAASPLAEPLGLPEPLLRAAGFVLLPIVAFIAWVAGRTEPPRWAVLAVVDVNALWAATSVIVLLAGGLDPNAFGVALVVAQAVAAAVMAELQYLGLRRSVTRPA